MQGARTTRTFGPSFAGSSRQQLLGARHRAGQRVAHPHGDRRRRRLAFLHHVEMGVEGRDLVDLGQRELHLLRERGEMRGGEMAVVVLDQMQMLDQQIAPARAVAEQRAHLVERLRIDLAALGRAPRLAAARLGAVACRTAADFEYSSASPALRIEPLPSSQTIPCSPWLDR